MKTISRWFDQAKQNGATHMLVVCDTYNHENYPVQVMPDQDLEQEIAKRDGRNMQRILECYAMHLDLEAQLNERRAYHTEKPVIRARPHLRLV